MSFSIAVVVLTAALLHAFWNAIVKGAGDKTIALGFIALGHVGPGALMVWYAGSPGWEAVPFIIASTVIHWAYYFLLNIAYRHGDLSLIYPIARGLAPVLIAAGAQIWADETLPLGAWAGILLVSGGIMVLTRGAFANGVVLTGVIAAVATAWMIAAYSLVDGIGVRVSGNPLGYIGWLFVAELVVVVFVFGVFRTRLAGTSARTIWLGLTGGIISGSAYALVLYAKTLAPLGVVSALRETSVIFAAMIGVMWFGEGPKTNRMIAALFVAAGIVVLGVFA